MTIRVDDENMNLTPYVFDAAGHAIQIISAMLLYFWCVPEERYRFSRRKTIQWFCAAAMAEIIITSIIKTKILEHVTWISPDMITILLLIAEFLILMAVTRRVIYVHPGPNRVIVLLGFFWASMQYMVVSLILVNHERSRTYDGITLLVFVLVTAVLLPVTGKLMAPYAKEYLLVRDRVRPQVRVIVSIMVLISILQIYTVSLHMSRRELPLLAMMSLSITVVYMLLIRYVVVEEQRARMELHLLASQIRPHFIRNTLNAICNLVDEDTDATIRAIYDFSGYLRMNFEALEKDTPVLFEEELEHAKFYLSIEKLRFRDELEIEINTPVKDFKIPALTVQPMVENAVRHGLRAKEGVGFLKLFTRETDSAYEVVIYDNGVGFQSLIENDAHPVKNDGHYGLVNVRSRLKRMVGGRLIIDSVIGEGTTVIIQIPKLPVSHTKEV